MRLLQIEGDPWGDDPLDITLCERIGTDIPPYMILSHRWREDEVLFTDMFKADRSIARERKGWAKLEASCRVALQLGLQYGWLDTCCIDKSSSAELSEAINSMYTYYARSSICFAYLDDVEDHQENDKSFQGSCWFTRGWTLQELIAPREVYFYSKGWKSIGSKSSMCGMVAEASSVPAELLLDPDRLDEYNVSQKMTFAAYRETTREEDESYSLMGIFGVNMPPLYGEGRERAFRRLQIEIMQQSQDHTLFTWNRWLISGDIFAASAFDFFGSYNYRIMDIEEYVEHFGLDPENIDYTMTNVGLRIQLPIVPVHRTENLYFAVLAVSVDSFDGAVAICLERQSSLRFKRYHRVSLHGVCVFHIRDPGTIKWTNEILWISAKPRGYQSVSQLSSLSPGPEMRLVVILIRNRLATLDVPGRTDQYEISNDSRGTCAYSETVSRFGFTNRVCLLVTTTLNLYIAFGQLNGRIWTFIGRAPEEPPPRSVMEAAFKYPSGELWRHRRREFKFQFPGPKISVCKAPSSRLSWNLGHNDGGAVTLGDTFHYLGGNAHKLVITANLKFHS